MKTGEVFLIAGIGVAALLLLSSSSAYAGSLNMDCLENEYDSDDVQRLKNVAIELQKRGLDNEQIKYCLAQILQETGIFTDSSANYRAVDDLNNYAGISSGGKLKSYPSISAFVTDYLRVLNLPSNYPIEATSITDFNNRLKANHYYEDSLVTYGNNLRRYYEILNNCEF